MRRALVLLTAFILLGFGATPALASEGEDERDESDDRGRGPPAPIGAFQVEERSRRAEGKQVAFSYSESGIQGFRYGNVSLLDITVLGRASEAEDDDDDDDTRVQARGGEMRVRMPTYRFTAHDNPIAASRLETDGTVSVAFAEGTILVQEEDGRLRFERDGLTGTIRANDPQVVDRTVTAHGDVLLFVDAPRGDFDRHRDHIGDAIARGHVGAEATWNRRPDRIEEEVVSYGNVTMTTLKAEEGNLTVLVDGHGFDGRVLVLNVDGRVLGASRADALNVLFDNASITHASNLTDILNPDDDGYMPEYYVVFDPAQEVFQLLVTVPHYSVHTLSIMTAIVLPPPSVTIGLIAGLALLVPAGFVLFRRK